MQNNDQWIDEILLTKVNKLSWVEGASQKAFLLLTDHENILRKLMIIFENIDLSFHIDLSFSLTIESKSFLSNYSLSHLKIPLKYLKTSHINQNDLWEIK